jgi:ribosomal protein S18 acetylase RimI-like enzyme
VAAGQQSVAPLSGRPPLISNKKRGLMKLVAIREAIASDAKNIAYLASQMGKELDEYTAKERIEGFLARDNELLLIAEKGEQALGLVSIIANYEALSGIQARVDIIVVDAAARRMGVGKMLMSKAEEWAREKGSKSLKLVSNVARVESHEFYGKLGYIKTKEQAQFRKEL